MSKHGDVVDFKLILDFSVSIRIEIEELKIDKLYDELSYNLAIDNMCCIVGS